MSFHELNLSEKVLKGVEAAGYTTPTEIQALAIPHVLEGRDVTGRAQTGTGKTAAFALPILARLERSPSPAGEAGHGEGRKRPRKPLHPVRALVLTPTRELAVQIEEAFKEYGRFVDVRTLPVYGGVRIDRQLNRLRAGVDIVIATPGRLLDHMSRGTIDLSRVEVFVLDEVDRMFDMGFIKDVRRIVAALPEERQTLLFSATISSQVVHLAKRLQSDSVLIEVGEQHNPVETVTQHVYPTARNRKLELLRTILENEHMKMVLVFCGRKDHADFVTRRLQHYGIDAMQLHSNLAQNERQQALDGFKCGEHRVLVATDIAARGIDIEGISHVVNYDVPRFAEDYIHRIGRTGRAEATGDAITFVGYEEEEYLRKIEDFIGLKFERKRYEGFDHGIIKLAKAKVSMRRRRAVSRRPGRKKYN